VREGNHVSLFGSEALVGPPQSVKTGLGQNICVEAAMRLPIRLPCCLAADHWFFGLHSLCSAIVSLRKNYPPTLTPIFLSVCIIFERYLERFRIYVFPNALVIARLNSIINHKNLSRYVQRL